MPYKEMYFWLFHAITDAIHEMQACNYGQAMDVLKLAQIDAEKLYMQNDAAEDEQEPHVQEQEDCAQEQHAGA